jgi:hypothetical protein
VQRFSFGDGFAEQLNRCTFQIDPPFEQQILFNGSLEVAGADHWFTVYRVTDE